MYYTIYKITNLINSKIYIGQHVTKNPHDSYYGSGSHIKRAIRKHGKHNFKKEVLHIFDNREDMITKEAELVNLEFINRTDTYNIILGGSYYELGYVNVATKENPYEFSRIKKEDYDKSIHIPPMSKKVTIKENGTYRQISSYEYNTNKEKYKTISNGKVSVHDYTDNITKSIPISTYDPNLHKKVFGGIVVEIDGIKQYVTREEFDNNGLKGIHSGRLTVKVNGSNVIKHVTKEEYYGNLHLYSHLTKGLVTAKNKITNEQGMFPVEIINKDRENWIVGTEGYVTVYSITENKYINVLKENLDPTIHISPMCKKIKCYRDNELLFEWFGTKQGFFDKYNANESVWAAVLKQETFIAKRTCKHLNGCKFELVDWKKDVSQK